MNSGGFLGNKLEELCGEMTADKNTVRHKAFEGMSDMIMRRSDDLTEHLNAAGSKQLNWVTCFKAASKGIQLQFQKLADATPSTLKTLQNKNPVYQDVLLKIVEKANRLYNHVPLKDIFSVCLEAIKNPEVIPVFGSAYLKLLDQQILKNLTPMKDISKRDYSRMIDAIFNLYDDQNVSDDQFYYMILRVVDVGVKNFEIGFCLVSKLESLVQFLQSNKRKFHPNLLQVCNLIAHTLAVESAELVINLLIVTHQIIFKMFSSRHTDKETKECIYEILNLSIVLQWPSTTLNLVKDNAKWGSLLRGSVNLIDLELEMLDKQHNVYVQASTLSPIFVEFAARATSHAFYDENIWNLQREDDQQDEKRKKHLMKMDAYIDRISLSSGKFSYRWFLVLGRALAQNDSLLTDTEHAVLLKLISEFQATIQTAEELSSFYLLCEVLIQFECHKKLKLSAAQIQIWNQITLATFRWCAGNNNKINNDCHGLFSLLIENKKFPSETFISSVLQAYLSGTIKKSDSSIQTLIITLLSFNINLLPEPRTIVKDLISNLFSANSRNINMLMSTEARPHEKLESIVLVLCTIWNNLYKDGFTENILKFLKRDIFNPSAIHYTSYAGFIGYNKKVQDLTTLILISNFKCALVEKFRPSEWNSNMKKTLPNKILYTIDEEMFGHFLKEYQASESLKQPSEIDSVELVELLVEKLHRCCLLINMLNVYIEMGCLDQMLFKSFQICKRIALIFQETEKIFPLIVMSNLSTKLRHDLLNILEEIFHTSYHEPVVHFIRSHNLKASLEWIKQCLLRRSLIVGKSEKFEKLQPTDLPSNISLNHRALMVLAQYLVYESQHTALIANIFSEEDGTEINCEHITDVGLFLDIAKVLAKCRYKSKVIKSFVQDTLNEIVTIHHPNSIVMDKAVNIIPDLLEFLMVFEDDNIAHDVITLITAIGNYAKNNYPTSTIKAILNTIKHFNKNFPYCFNMKGARGNTVYEVMVTFLLKTSFEIQVTTAQQIVLIFHRDWTVARQISRQKDLNDFQMLLLDFFKKAIVEMKQMDDYQICMQKNLLIQMFCFMMCGNFFLRDKIGIMLVDLFMPESGDSKKIQSFFTILEKVTSYNIQNIIEHMMLTLIGYWFRQGYSLQDFPWFLTEATCREEFFFIHSATFTVGVIPISLDALPTLATMTQMQQNKLILDTVPSLIAAIVPCIANIAKDISSAEKTNILRLKNVLMKEEHLVNAAKDKIFAVIGVILSKVYDKEKAIEYFGRNHAVYPCDTTLNYKDFTLCLSTLSLLLTPDSDSTIVLPTVCAHEPNQIQSLLFIIEYDLETATAPEYMLLKLFHFALCMDEIKLFLRHTKDAHIRIFIIKNCIHFICNKIVHSSDDLLRCLIAYMKYFCAEFMPLDMALFKTELPFIINSLLRKFIDLEFGAEQRNIIDIVEYLLVDNAESFKDAIQLLPEIPNHPELSKLNLNKVQAMDTDAVDLIKEIIQFNNMEFISSESFKSLAYNLAICKDQLVELYNAAQIIRFSSESLNSCLHQLVWKLLNLVQSDGDNNKLRLAAKCLGELGSSDLRIMSLYSRKSLEFYKGHAVLQDCCIEFYSLIMKKLPEALLDPRGKVKFAASSAATLLVQTHEGRKLLEQFPQLKIFRLQKDPEFAVCFTKPSQLERLNDIFVKDAGTKSFQTWIIDACTTLLAVINEFCLKELLKYHVDFAKDLFPALIKLYLAFNTDEINKKLEVEVSNFFAKFYEIVCDTSGTHENCRIFTDKEIIRSMLNLVECNRLQFNEIFYGGRMCNPKLKLDYKHIIKAAVYCEAHFTAILYGELWAFSKVPESGICLDVKEDQELCEILQTSYSAIRATDITDYLIDPIEQRKSYLMSRNMYSKIMQEMNADSDLSEISNVLMKNGFHRIAHVINRFDTHTKYETSWKLCDWSVIDELVETNSNENFKIEFEKNHYGALKQFHRDDSLSVSSFIEKARDAVVKMLRNTAIETPQSLYGFFGMLNRLQQIEDACKVKFNRSENNVDEMLSKWGNADMLPATEFKWTELKLSQRICLLRGAGVRAHRSWVPNVLQETIANLITFASKNNCDGVATSNIALLKELNLCQDYAKILLIDADISYKQGAIHLAKQSLKQAINEGNNIVKMIAYRKLGEFSIDDTFCDSPQKVFQTFFGESIKLLNHYASRNNRLQDMECGVFADDDIGRNIKSGICIFEKVAKFYDREYTKTSTFMKSSQFIQRKNLVQRQKYAVDELEKKMRQEKTNRDENRLYNQLNTNYCIDAKELEQLKSDRNSYAAESLKYYIKHAKMSDNGHLNIFRIISLWLANKKVDAVREEIVASTGLLTIPTHVFLGLIPQLCARLTNKNSTYVEETIYKILFKCAVDHPHHTLTHIMALAKSHDDLLCLKSSQSQPSQEPRVVGANQMLKDLAKTSSSLATCIKQFDKMSTNMIKFAYREINSGTISTVDCRNEPIMKVQNLTHVHCPTAALPISLNCKYEDIISIVKWEPTIGMVGGINAPKKMVCICSDGKKRIQLLKGNDDIRQDAVMQQVFTMMNRFLKNDPEANEKKLNVKTYKVIPFSRRSGMLEWCDNTAPLGQILQNLHTICRPYGMDLRAARTKMDQYRHEKQPAAKLLAFQNICKEVRPVFHHFLLKSCKVPGTWFERKLCYINSVATTSVVGYILGIGDRHVNNILVDTISSELVHIDFGIAFDAGKSLATPETIPFRLTREIVAGMGITGIEGTFKNSSRITMKILRENQTTILAILECLLYDPLYTWTLTSEKARRTQSLEYDPNIVDEDRNTSAERALQCILGKLNGREGEFSGQMSIEGQIDRLIQQATHEFNLCRLFPGWQPYL